MIEQLSAWIAAGLATLVVGGFFGWLAATSERFAAPRRAKSEASRSLMDKAIIEADKFGLGDWELVESGEQAMLAQVARNEGTGTPSVFLAWAPHPMNVKHKLTYLSGGDAEFGPDFGGASVHTLARKEWVAACPNAAKLFSQLVFDVDMENLLMGNILDDGMSAEEAAKGWIAAHPDTVKTWLDGVTTLDGQPGADAVMASVN